MVMDLERLVISIAGEALVGVPASSLKALVSAVIERRRKAAFEILLKELRQGKIQLPSVDDAVSAVLRYQRAADEGVARQNLRLMAQVIAGKAFLGNLKADEFVYYADMLSSLRREEIIFLAMLYKVQKAWLGKEGGPNPLQHWAIVEGELIPSVFPDKQALRATATACLRTGLLSDDNTMDDSGWYMTTRLMDDLQMIAPFEAALDEVAI